AEPVAVPELFHLVRLDAVYDLIRKMLRRDAAHTRHVGRRFYYVVPYCVYKVRLSEPDAAVYEEWVIRLSGLPCDCRRRSVGELVTRPYYKPVERVIRVENAGEELGGLSFLLGLFPVLVPVLLFVGCL